MRTPAAFLSALMLTSALAMAQSAPPPATAPTPKEIAARQALRTFFHALLVGDEKTAFGLLTYAKPENQKIAEALFIQTAASQRLVAAAQTQFGKDPSMSLDLTEDQAAEIEKNMDKAKVTLKGDLAEVVVDATLPAFVLVYKDGTWKVDFEHTQDNMGPLPSAEEQAASRKVAAAFDQITADIKAKKFHSIEEVREQVHIAQRLSGPNAP